MRRLLILLLGLAAVQLIAAQTYPTYQVETADWTTTDCSLDATACDALSNTVCVEQTPGTSTSALCRCDVENRFKMRTVNAAQVCVYQSELGETCAADTAECTDPNAECVDDGTNQNQGRCKCKDYRSGYYDVLNDATPPRKVCAKVLSRQEQADCGVCLDNDGMCYNLPPTLATDPFSGTKDGCSCPISRTGDNCENIHVVVTCDLQEFMMDICYEPHPTMTGSIEMYTDGKSSVQSCQGKLLDSATATTECVEGNYLLKLPMKPGLRDACGTTPMNSGVGTTKFENKIIVTKDPTDLSEAIIYKTYCSFVMQADKSTGAIGVAGVNQNDQGQHLSPTITAVVRNQLGMNILGKAVRMGDLVVFEMTLENDGTYAAINALFCTASSSAVLGDPKATTKPLISDGCPETNSPFGIFTRKSKQPNVLQTGLVKMFKTGQGDDVFVHCRLKVCLTGEEDNCAPRTDCASGGTGGTGQGGTGGTGQGGTGGTGQGGTGGTVRRRRAVNDQATQNETNVDLHIKVIDPSEYDAKTDNPTITMTLAGFSVIIALLIGLVIISMSVAALLLYKLKSKGNKVDDQVEMSQKPQRFALPRVNRTHLRL